MKVINLIGPSNSGKSTTVYGLLFIMKRLGMNVEFASEYAKDMVYENRGNILQDQLYILAKQNRKLSRLAVMGVEFAVTDTCLLLGNVYSPDDALPELKAVITAYFNQYDNDTFYLPTNENFAFRTEGRVQKNRAESDALVGKIEAVLPEATHRLTKADSDDYIFRILEHLGVAEQARKLYPWSMMSQEEKLAEFNNDVELAAEYSNDKSCPQSDSGYHCSCYDRGKSCDLCEKEPNHYRGPVRTAGKWAPTSGPGIPEKPSIKK